MIEVNFHYSGSNKKVCKRLEELPLKEGEIYALCIIMPDNRKITEHKDRDYILNSLNILRQNGADNFHVYVLQRNTNESCFPSSRTLKEELKVVCSPILEEAVA